MKHIESLLNNDWVTPPMQKNKKIAKKLKYFTFQKYFDKLDSLSNEKEKKELFNNIYNLSIFVKNVENEDIEDKYQKRINEFKDFLNHINEGSYKNEFKEYKIMKKNPDNLDLLDINQNHINKLTTNFRLNQKIGNINCVLNELSLTLDYSGGHKKIKKFDNERKMIYGDHKRLKNLINQLKEDKDFQNYELEKLIEKEKFINKKVSKTLSLLEQQKQSLKKRKRFSYIIKFVAGLAFIASLLEIGKFYSENGEEIKSYFNNKIEPKIESVKKPNQETTFYYLQ